MPMNNPKPNDLPHRLTAAEISQLTEQGELVLQFKVTLGDAIAYLPEELSGRLCILFQKLLDYGFDQWRPLIEVNSREIDRLKTDLRVLNDFLGKMCRISGPGSSVSAETVAVCCVRTHEQLTAARRCHWAQNP